jgi:hypothetical protein
MYSSKKVRTKKVLIKNKAFSCPLWGKSRCSCPALIWASVHTWDSTGGVTHLFLLSVVLLTRQPAEVVCGWHQLKCLSTALQTGMKSELYMKFCSTVIFTTNYKDRVDTGHCSMSGSQVPLCCPLEGKILYGPNYLHSRVRGWHWQALYSPLPMT